MQRLFVVERGREDPARLAPAPQRRRDIGVLAVLLAYVWRKGDLEWVRAEDRR